MDKEKACVVIHPKAERYVIFPRFDESSKTGQDHLET